MWVMQSALIVASVLSLVMRLLENCTALKYVMMLDVREADAVEGDCKEAGLACTRVGA